MDLQNALDKLLPAFQGYYTLKTEQIKAPFQAEATFRSRNEQYFLLKSARISEADSNEFVYFHTTDYLDSPTLADLDSCAWERGIGQVRPDYHHNRTDVALIILAEKISEDAKMQIKKLKHSKSYKFGLNGFSNYRVLALELSTSQLYCNRLGKSLKQVINHTLYKKDGN